MPRCSPRRSPMHKDSPRIKKTREFEKIYDELYDKYDELRKENDELKSVLLERDQENKRQKEVIAISRDLQATVDELNKRSEELAIDLGVATKRLLAAEAECQEWMNSHNERSAEVDELNELVQHVVMENADLKGKNKLMDGDLLKCHKKMADEARASKAALSDLNQQILALTAELEETKVAYENCKSALKNIELERDASRMNETQYTEQTGKLKDQIGTLIAELREVKADRDGCRSEIARLEREREFNKQKELIAKGQDMPSTIDELNKRSEELAIDLGVATKKLLAAEAECQEWMTSHNERSVEVNELNELLHHLTTEIADLKEKNELMDDELMKCRKKMADEARASEESISDLNQQNLALTTELEETKVAYENCKSALMNVELELDASRMNETQCTEHAAKLKDQIGALTAELCEIKADRDSCRSENDSLSAETRQQKLIIAQLKRDHGSAEKKLNDRKRMTFAMGGMQDNKGGFSLLGSDEDIVLGHRRTDAATPLNDPKSIRTFCTSTPKTNYSARRDVLRTPSLPRPRTEHKKPQEQFFSSRGATPTKSGFSSLYHGSGGVDPEVLYKNEVVRKRNQEMPPHMRSSYNPAAGIFDEGLKGSPSRRPRKSVLGDVNK